jgi:two-component system sensor kinase FixL
VFWVTIIWSMIAAACLTLAGIHFSVWYTNRRLARNLLFSLMAVATATFAFFEMWMMRAQTPTEFAAALRWAYVPMLVWMVSIAWFVRVYLKAGRRWLAWTVSGVSTFSLLPNFLGGQNLNYRQILVLRHIPFLGESVAVADGVHNPWMMTGQLSALLLLIFVADAGVAVWRRGDTRKALLLVGSIGLVLVGTIQAVLVYWRVAQAPLTLSPFFLVVVTLVGYELSRDVRRGAKLSRDLEASKAGLRESEVRMQLAANAAELGVWTWDIAGDSHWVNDKARLLFGIDSERIDFNTFFETIYPDDRERVTQAVAKTMNSDSEYQIEYRVVLPDHSLRWIGSRGRMEFNGEGKPIFLRGVSMDLSKRKQAEETRKNLAAIVESSDDAILSKTLEGKITSWNAGAEKVYGYSASEIVGQNVSTLAPTDLKEEVTGILERLKRGESVDHLETARMTKDGRQIDVSLTISPIRDERGTIIAASTIARDITARKRAEFEALQQRSELARLSRVTMLGQLSGSLAHELNQPLGAILRNTEAAELLLQEPSPDLEETRAILSDIGKDSQRAGAVIEGMRSMLERRQVEQNVIDLDGLVKEVIRLVQPDAGSRQARVVLEDSSSKLFVHGDRVQLQQVLLNLLLNALDAVADCAAGRRQITVRVQNARTRVEVSVSDTGHGIPTDKLARIFEPFFTTKPNGIGIGLPISRTIVEVHGGSIRAENSPGGGARFYFTLPVVKEPTS